MLSHPSHAQECAIYNQAALKYVVENSRIHTVILAGYWSASFPLQKGYGYISLGEEATGTSKQNWTNFQLGLEQTVRQLREGNKAVIIATDVPRFSADPLLLTIGQAIPVRGFLGGFLSRGKMASGEELESITVSSEDLQANRIIASVAEQNQAHVLNLSQGICDGVFCKYALNGSSLYVDEQHLSSLGANMALQDPKIF
jgi:hypothetical protein